MENELAALKQELDSLDAEIADLQHRKFITAVRFQLLLKQQSKVSTEVPAVQRAIYSEDMFGGTGFEEKAL
jgi:hypothetical protein